jgi:hypothetical protein
MARSIDIVLNAFDNTGPGVDSATANLNAYTNAAASIDSSVTSSFSSLALTAGVAVAAIGAVAAGAYLIYQNWANIGPLFDSVRNAIGGALASAYNTVAGFVGGVIGATTSWADVMQWASNVGYGALATIEFGFKNWRQVGELALVAIQFGVVQTFNQLVYTLTEVVPGYLVWFWENWRQIFQTVWDFTKTVVTNLHENLVRFFTALFEYLQGNGFNFEFKGLTDGFEASIKKLPEIAARELGPLEESLRERFDKLGAKVGGGLVEHVGKRLSNIPQFKRDIADFASGIGSSIAGFFAGGPRGGQQQVQQLQGEQSRFLTGAAAAGEERDRAEQIKLAREQAEIAKQTKDTNNLIRAAITGDVTALLRVMASRGGGGIALP